MQIIEKKIVFGLQWKTAINESKKELKNITTDAKATGYCIVTRDMHRTYGLATIKKLSGTKAAAAVVAHILGEKGGVFVHQVTPALCCFIAVEHGIPVEDQIGERDDMISAAKTYIHDQVDAAIAVHGDIEVGEFAGVEEMAIDQLLVDFDSVGKITAVSKFNSTALFAGAIVAVSALTWYSDDIMHAFAPPKKPALVVTPQDRYKQQVGKALAEVAKAGRFRNNVMPAFVAMADPLPFKAPGWQYDLMKCQDTKCIATWKRLKGGTAEGILAALNAGPKDASVSFPTVDKLQKQLEFNRAALTQEVELASNATLDPIVLTWIQDLKDRGFEATYSSAIPLVAPESGFTPQKEDIVLVGDYSIDLPYRNINDVMKLPNSMTIERIDVTAHENKAIVATIKGKYYAH